MALGCVWKDTIFRHELPYSCRHISFRIFLCSMPKKTLRAKTLLRKHFVSLEFYIISTYVLQ